MLGAGGIGKTSTVGRLVANEWTHYHDTYCEQWCNTDISVDGKMEAIEILDTMGQEQYEPLQRHWIRQCDGFVLLYSINNDRSFKYIEDIYYKIGRHREDEWFELILVANKCDLPPQERDVSYEMGKELAELWGIPFIEQSAKTGDNVREAFEMLVRQMRTPFVPIEVDNDERCNACQIM